MRHQDQLLLKQFVYIHNTISRLRRQQQLVENDIPRSMSDATETKVWRTMKRSGAARNRFNPSQLPTQTADRVSDKEAADDEMFSPTFAHKHVDDFMMQFRENLLDSQNAAHTQASKSRAVTISDMDRAGPVLQLSREDSVDGGSSEC